MEDMIRDERETALVIQAVNNVKADEDSVDAIILERITNMNESVDGPAHRRATRV